MTPILGFDYGNFYSQLVWIQNLDATTRRGGVPLDLRDPTSPDPNGIPTAFFRSAKRNDGKPLCGYQATRQSPASNIVRFLKRNMRGSITLDGITYTYAAMITQTMEHCIAIANRQLYAQSQQTTNLIALAYPVTFSAEDRAFLKELAERVTVEIIENGKTKKVKVKVVGTITEPAAAALDYLAEHPGARPETCVMAYDLGAGTFDLSVVQAFPNGRQYPTGGTYYYLVRWNDGLSKLGGKEFDQIIFDLLVKKTGVTPKGTQADEWLRTAETIKRELTNDPVTYPALMINGNIPDIKITQEEFNALAKPLVQQTVDMVKAALDNQEVPKPDLILLAGGASRMPIVSQMLEEQLPAYRGRIIPHKFSEAIAHGAARFATDEKDPIIHTHPVQQCTTLSLGFRCTDGKNHQHYIDTVIPQGTPIPCTSEEHTYQTLYNDQSGMEMGVFEAVNANPVTTEADRDYRNMNPHSYDFGRPVPSGTSVVCQIHIDKDNMLHVTAWEQGRKAQTKKTWHCGYHN